MSSYKNLITLGDGNTSFSYAICKRLAFNKHINSLLSSTNYKSETSHDFTQYNFFVTTFDDEDALLAKYPTSRSFLKYFRQYPSNITYCGGVNAVDLTTSLSLNLELSNDDHHTILNNNNNNDSNIINEQNPLTQSPFTTTFNDNNKIPKFCALWFNNPHVGVEDHHRHIALLSHFFASAIPLLTPNTSTTCSQIIITLCDDQARRWELFQCARRFGFICISAIEVTSEIFPQFENKRHQNDSSFPYHKMIQYYFIYLKDIQKDDINILNNIFTQYIQLSNEKKNYSLIPKYNKFDLWKLTTSSSLSDIEEQLLTYKDVDLQPNWASDPSTFVPLLPILNPVYAFFPLTDQLPQTLSEFSPQKALYQLIFMPLLSISHVINAYKRQLADLQNNYFSKYIIAKYNQLQYIQSLSIILKKDYKDLYNYFLKTLTPEETVIAKTGQIHAIQNTLVGSNLHTRPESTLSTTMIETENTTVELSLEEQLKHIKTKLPGHISLPTHLNPMLLGRSLNSRETIKLDRFIQRSQSKPSKRQLTHPKMNDIDNNDNDDDDDNYELFICTNCDEKREFPTQLSLKQHIDAKHTISGQNNRSKDIQPTAEITLSMFTPAEYHKYLTTLARDTHTSLSLPYNCPVCKLGCLDLETYDKHLKYLSPNIIHYICPRGCKKQFTNAIALQQHITHIINCAENK